MKTHPCDADEPNDGGGRCSREINNHQKPDELYSVDVKRIPFRVKIPLERTPKGNHPGCTEDVEDCADEGGEDGDGSKGVTREPADA